MRKPIPNSTACERLRHFHLSQPKYIFSDETIMSCLKRQKGNFNQNTFKYFRGLQDGSTHQGVAGAF